MAKQSLDAFSKPGWGFGFGRRGSFQDELEEQWDEVEVEEEEEGPVISLFCL